MELLLNINSITLKHLIERLKIFTQYYVSITAGTQITGFGPFSDAKIIRTGV